MPASSGSPPITTSEGAVAMEVESDQDQDRYVMIDAADALDGLYAWMLAWYDQYLYSQKQGEPRSVPPLFMMLFPRLFEKAWGYDRLYPQAFDDWCPYRAYLQEFCSRNGAVSPDPDAYKLCMEQEISLKSEWVSRRTFISTDEIRLSDDIQKCTLKLMFSNSGEGSSIAMMAATCIAKETELIIERLSCDSSLLDPEEPPHQSTQIRKLALSYMQGPQSCSDAALLVQKAALLGITIEARLMAQNLRENHYDSYEAYLNRMIRGFALEVVRQKFDGLIAPSAHDDFRADFVAKLEEDAENRCRGNLVNSDPASEEASGSENSETGERNDASCAPTQGDEN